jgi:Glycosyltransferase family 87
MDANWPRFEGRLRPGTLARLVRLGFLLLAVVLAFRFAALALPRYLPKDWSKAHEYDGLQDWLAARLHAVGGSPYSPEGLAVLKVASYGHQPTTSFWFIPLAYLDKAVAAELVSLSALPFLLIHIYLCARELAFKAPLGLSILLFAWALTTEGFVIHWHAVQLSEQIALPLTVCWIYLRRGKQLPAGLALGVAATLKLFPGVLMLFLLFARRFRAFIAASALFGGVAAVMTASYGLDCWRLFFSQQKPVAIAWMGSVRNASLQGIIVRLLTPTCTGTAYPSVTASYLAAGIGLGLLLLAGWWSRGLVRRAREQDARAIDLPFALFTVLAVLVNPWIWEHYWVLLIQPAFVVSDSFQRHFRGVFRAWLDERDRLRTLLAETALLALCIAGVGAVMTLLGTQDIRTERLEDLWNTTHSSWAHRQLHLYEAFNCLPWLIMLLLCFVAVLRQRGGRQARGA